MRGPTTFSTYVLISVTGCGGTLEGDVYTTGPVSADCTVTAVFGLPPPDMIFSNGFDGT